MKTICFFLGVFLLISPFSICRAQTPGSTETDILDASQSEAIMKLSGSGAVIEGDVKEVSEGKTGKVSFINFTDPTSGESTDFHVVIFEKTLKMNPEVWSGFLRDLPGKRLRVSGVVSEYKGRVQIIVKTMEELMVIDEPESK